MNLPLATAELPGTGGQIGPRADDFLVTEQAAYAPAGEGSHCFVRIRKVGLTSFEAVARLARALGISPREVGMAGLKDRWAVTEQWLSVPGLAPPQVLGLTLEGVEILEAQAHPRKLRTGHLRGNRFAIRLVDTVPQALLRAQAVLAAARERGIYHLYGPQRFGRQGDNAELGLRLLRTGRGPREPRRRRLMVSAAQAALFHRYLVARLAKGPLWRPLAGEVVQRTDSGGIFLVTDPAEAEARLARKEIVPTGPLYGPRMKRAAAQSEAEALEAQVLEEAGLDFEQLASWRRLAPGGRRPLLVRPQEVDVEATPDGLWLRFFLPAGAYATVLLREVTKIPFDRLRSVPEGPEPDDRPAASGPPL